MGNMRKLIVAYLQLPMSVRVVWGLIALVFISVCVAILGIPAAILLFSLFI